MGRQQYRNFPGCRFLPAGSEWPECPNCQNPMQLFLQLNSDTLPEEVGKLWGDGLMQFFYCTNSTPLCEVDCEAYFPFSRSTLLRTIIPEKNEVESRHPESPVQDAFPAKKIVGWTKTDDLPNWMELEELGFELPDKKYEPIEDTYPRAGDKLWGWPLWIQGIEYPDCPQCATRMRLLFQIDSNRNLPFEFGDIGTGHITQCPNHIDVLAFGWACS